MAIEARIPHGTTQGATLCCALSLVFALGCSPHATAPVASPATAAPPGKPVQGPTDDPRALAPNASYGDLVARIGLLDGHAQEAGRESCILARYTRTGHFELRGELAVAVRPPPAPPEDLDAALQQSTTLRLLSRYGSVGEGPLVLVELTATRPTRAVAVLALTDQGAYLGQVGPAPAWQGPVELAALKASLADLATTDDPVRLEVLAEAALPVARLDDALLALNDLNLAVSLATALPEGTELPESLTARADPTCPDGLPALQEAPGQLAVDTAQAQLVPFAEAARVCAHQVGGRAMAGGKVVLAMRVRPDGNVGEVCSVSDEIGEPGLLECLRQAAAAVRFPELNGHVDLHLPLRIAAGWVRTPLPACE